MTFWPSSQVDALRLGAAQERLRTVKKLVGNVAPSEKLSHRL